MLRRAVHHLSYSRHVDFLFFNIGSLFYHLDSLRVDLCSFVFIFHVINEIYKGRILLILNLF